MVAQAGATESLSGRSAHERITRTAAAFVGVGGLFYGFVQTPGILTQSSLTPVWWTPFAVVIVFGPAFAIVVAAVRSSMRTIRRTIDVFAAGYLVAVVTWLVIYDGAATLAVDQGTWLSMFPGVAALALSVSRRAGFAFAYLLVAGPLCQWQSWLARENNPNPLVFELLYAVVFSALYVAACAGAVRSGQLLDETAESARDRSARSAATEARGAERRRFDALIHDGVMATFLSASRTTNTQALAAQATATLRQLDRLRTGISSTDAFDAEDLVTLLRTSAAAVDDNAPITATVTTDAERLLVPPEVARALGAGLIEALRNIARHAGDATYEVRIEVSDTAVRVDVVDDGAGFDPTAVPRHRLGLQVSIRGRFRELAGGWSSVESAPGSGTRIAMGWSSR